MKTHHPKLKTTPRPLFSCAFFRNCTQTTLSPTTSNPPALPFSNSDHPPLPPPSPPAAQPQTSTEPPLRQAPPPESESSSSSNSSQSFTQWRFPLPTSPYPYSYPAPKSTQKIELESDPTPKSGQLIAGESPLQAMTTDLQELFHVAELQLSAGSEIERVKALSMLERSLVPNPRAAFDGGEKTPCPAAVMKGVLGYLKDKTGAKSASKIILALCLVESNRHVGVEFGAVGMIVEALAEMEGAAAERSLAALELLCTVAEGAAEVRAHALAVPMMVEVMGRMEGRGREYAISVLTVIYGSPGEGPPVAPPEELASAVALALQGDCSARGRRKGAQLLKILQENGRSDLTPDGR